LAGLILPLAIAGLCIACCGVKETAKMYDDEKKEDKKKEKKEKKQKEKEEATAQQ